MANVNFGGSGGASGGSSVGYSIPSGATLVGSDDDDDSGGLVETQPAPLPEPAPAPTPDPEEEVADSAADATEPAYDPNRETGTKNKLAAVVDTPGDSPETVGSGSNAGATGNAATVDDVVGNVKKATNVDIGNVADKVDEAVASATNAASGDSSGSSGQTSSPMPDAGGSRMLLLAAAGVALAGGIVLGGR